MGLLSLGTPLDWHESKKFNEHVRENGSTQLINIYKQHHARDNDKYYWGDEIEYMLVNFNDKTHQVSLSIDKDHIIDDLNDPSNSQSQIAKDLNVSFHPEYGRYMIEATPLRPFDGDQFNDYIIVEENMINRRKLSQAQLPNHIKPLTLTSFPRMGCPNFTSPIAKPIGPASQSLFLPDEIINRHARFPTLTANIRKRRGCKVVMNLPMYPDKNTKLLDDSIPDRDLFESDKEYKYASIPGHVYLDSMGFGMGASCLQMTIQLLNITEARSLYDSLAPITPLLLSLSAAAPIFKGFLVNQDVRWNVISGAVDDRTFIEKNIDAYPGYDYFGGLDIHDDVKLHFSDLGGGKGVNGDRIINSYGDIGVQTEDGKSLQKIPKSRYASIDNYLVNDAQIDEKFNDIVSPINSQIYSKLVKNGFDKVLAKHFAHLFIRDPLVIFNERLDQNNLLENDHFENIQSTNWQTLRFKPPSLYDHKLINDDPKFLSTTPGWRVEFRPTEIQLTDFENAAYTSFIILLSRAILKFQPNLYIPILKIDENMDLAHKVNSVVENKFWFKNFEQWELDCDAFKGYDISWFDRFVNEGNDFSIYTNGYASTSASYHSNGYNIPKQQRSFTNNSCKYTINEIINGSGNFPGLIRLVVRYIATDLIPQTKEHCPHQSLSKVLRLQHYLLLISGRASGKIPTIATFLRTKVLNSSHYRQDSKINEALNYDLVKLSDAITNLDFQDHEPELMEYFGTKIGNYLKVNNHI